MRKPRKVFMVSTHVDTMKVHKEATESLKAGVHPLYVIEKALALAEDLPEIYHVGYGGYPDENGEVSLDAAIMLGPGHKVGAVGDLRGGFYHAITLARIVMEKTTHPLIVGKGAEELARKYNLPRKNLLTDQRRQEWKEWRKNPHKRDFWQDKISDTVGILVRDHNNNLYAGVSTSGVPFKIPGRIGDSPLVGHGIYVDNEVGAAVAIGNGDVLMIHCPTFRVIELMRQGQTPQSACKKVVSYLYQKAGDHLEKASPGQRW